MKILISFLICHLLFVTVVTAQQNHVINGNFEDVISCPSTHSQVSRCANWRQYTTGTSDYYHSCASFTGVPTNFNGYQRAASGQAYMGGTQFTTYSFTSDKEYIAGKMKPLIPGRAYRVSMSVSLSNNSEYGTNDLGIYFYDSGATTVNQWSVLNVTPQIMYSDYGPIMDTTDWVRLSKVFIADSAYDNLVIGGFLSYNKLTRDSFQYQGSAYYYFDSVVVAPVDSLEQMSLNDSAFCVGDTVKIEYNTLIKYNTNNVFQIQLSDKSGDFSNPTIIGSVSADTTGDVWGVIPPTVANGEDYKIRIFATSPADSTKPDDVTLEIANPDSTTYNITTKNSPVCEDKTALFEADVNYTYSKVTYSWTGQAGFASTSKDPLIASTSLSHQGSYYATIKFNGCEVKDTTYLSVDPTPKTPNVWSSSPTCEGELLNLYATSTTTGVSYQWQGPNGFSSSSQNPVRSSATTNMAGTYWVTAKLKGCVSVGSTTVTINPMPDTPSLSNNSSICEGDSLGFSLSPATSGATYAWSGPDNFTSTSQNPHIKNSTTAANGWYYATVNLNGCELQDSTKAEVYAYPAVPSLGWSGPLCEGETLSILASNVPGATYHWSGPGNYSSNNQNVSRSGIKVADAGTYTVYTSQNGCAAQPTNINVAINPAPFVVIQASPGDTICQGDPAVFTALPNNTGGTPQYQWYVNTQMGSTGKVFTTANLKDGDIIRCYMTEYTKCSAQNTDASNDIQINVLPWKAPVVSISAKPNRPLKEDEYVTFTANVQDAGPMPLYQWKRNGKDEQGATGNKWSANTLNDNDKIWVEVTSTYRCPLPQTVSSNDITIQVLSSVNDVASKHSIDIYPNPNSGTFIIRSELLQQGVVALKMTNTLGQVVHHENIAPKQNANTVQVSTKNIIPGIYLLTLTGDGWNATYRINIQ